MTARTLKITTPSEREIELTRVFDAPRPMVWQALTRPELLRRWYGPHGYRLVECEIDLRVGGSWRYVVRAPDDSDMELQGTYREISSPARLVQTETNNDCDAAAGIQGLTTIELTETNGRTMLTSRSRYSSRQARDAVLNSGMDRGVSQAYDRLNTMLLSELPSGEPMAGELVSNTSGQPASSINGR